MPSEQGSVQRRDLADVRMHPIMIGTGGAASFVACRVQTTCSNMHIIPTFSGQVVELWRRQWRRSMGLPVVTTTMGGAGTPTKQNLRNALSDAQYNAEQALERTLLVMTACGSGGGSGGGMLSRPPPSLCLSTSSMLTFSSLPWEKKAGGDTDVTRRYRLCVQI